MCVSTFWGAVASASFGLFAWLTSLLNCLSQMNHSNVALFMSVPPITNYKVKNTHDPKLWHLPCNNQMSVTGQKMEIFNRNGSEALWKMELGRKHSVVPNGCLHTGNNEHGKPDFHVTDCQSSKILWSSFVTGVVNFSHVVMKLANHPIFVNMN